MLLVIGIICYKIKYLINSAGVEFSQYGVKTESERKNPLI